ncbi:MAG: NADH-quinone oxidoreductase subunit L, partial [Nocardioidaceae bacterium]
VMTLITLAVVLVGAAIGYVRYRAEIPREAPVRVSPVTTFARKDLYGDALNETVFMRPGQYLTRSLVFVDGRGIDGTVNGIAGLTGRAADAVRRWQNGYVRSYALATFGGALLVVLAMLAVNLT